MYDFHTICRTCSLQGELISLFIEQPYIIADMLTEVVDLKVIKDDNLPQNICKDCLEALKHAYEFKKQCEAVQAKLNECLTNGYGPDGIFIVSIKEEINFYENSNDASDLQVVADLNIPSPDQLSFEGEIEVLEESPSSNKDVRAHSCERENDEEGEIEILEAPPSNVCHICDKDVGNQLVNHMRTHNRAKFKCEFCHKLFRYREMLRRHQRTHTGEKPYKCKICNKSFAQLGSLNNHLFLHTGEKPYTCTVCNKRFARKTSLTKHSMIHTDKKPYTCKYCNQKFRQPNHLNAHERIHTGERPYQCMVCGKQFSLNQTLKGHMRTHTGEQPYNCSLCGNVYTQLSTLKTHIRIKHGSDTGSYVQNVKKPPEIGEFECKTCHETFKFRREFIKHKRVHRNKSYLCSHCGKEFFTTIGLRSHMITHSGVKPYECPLCEKRFARTQSLKKHEAFHTGERKYQCTICEQRFKQSSHLRTHIRTHTGEKPHKCAYCDKRFAENGNLVVHMRIHTGEKPYVCAICGKGFYHLTTMKKHRVTHLYKDTIKDPPEDD